MKILLLILCFSTLNIFPVSSQDIGEVNLCLNFNQETGKTTGQGLSFDTGNIAWYFITYSSFDPKKQIFNFDAFRFILNKEGKHFFDAKFAGVKGFPCVNGDLSLSPGNYQIIILAESENIVLGKSDHFIINK